MGWLLSIVGAGLGTLIAGVVASRYSSGDESRDARSHWPRVSGMITDSKIAINGRDEPSGWQMHNWLAVRPHWDLTVSFSYVVQGVQCAGEQRWYTKANDKTGAQEEGLTYLAGKTVIVNYDPQEPARAVIDPAKPTMKESDVKFFSEVVGGLLGMLGTMILAWRLLGWSP